jgi:phosphatidate phosphatase APP1
MRAIYLAGSLVVLAISTLAGCASREPREVAFFPSTVAVASDGSAELMVQGRAFRRAPSVAQGSRELEADVAAVAPAQKAMAEIYDERVRLLRSSGANETLAIDVGGETFPVTPGEAGNFRRSIALNQQQLQSLAADGFVGFHDAASLASGKAAVVPNGALMVLTDMDDTIKISEMTCFLCKVKRAFYLAHEAVPGMKEQYQKWQADMGPAIHFHVVSAGPWQWQLPLQQFTDQQPSNESYKFPPFTWDMRVTELSTLAGYIREAGSGGPLPFKIKTIRALMDRFPQSQFVLIGDSGEKDPEVFGTLLRQDGMDGKANYAARIKYVFIRNVTGDLPGHARYQAIGGKLRLFRTPSELPASLR